MVGAQKTASICRRVLLILPRVIGGKLYSSMGWLDVDGLLDVHLHLGGMVFVCFAALAHDVDAQT